MARKNLNQKRVFLDPLDQVFEPDFNLKLIATDTNSEKILACREGNTYRLKPSDAIHWIRVLRANTGQQLEVTCSKSAKTFKAFIAKITKDKAYVTLLEQLNIDSNAEITPQQHLFIGLPKSKSLELLIEKAVELSVTSINIWEASHSVAKLKENKEMRLSKIIESAAKQSKQNKLADLKILDSLSDLENRIKELLAAEGSVGFICSLATNSQKIQTLELKLSTPQLIAIGPEGDFSKEEEELFLKYNFQAIHLCSSVLRTETAVITALAMLQARTS